MSRWGADSDFDYYDEPWGRPEKCATKDCIGIVTFPDREAFCTSCLFRREHGIPAKAALPAKKEPAA